jgi:hypothetical protein
MEAIRHTTLKGSLIFGTEGTSYERIPELTSQYSLTLARLADLYASPAPNEEPLAEFERDLLLLGRHIRSLKEQAASERDPAARRRLLEEMRRSADSLAESLVESAQERNPSRAPNPAGADPHPGEDPLHRGGDPGSALAHVEEHRLHVVSLSNRARRNLLTTIPLTGLVGIYLVLFLPSRVVRSLRRITHVLQQAERGISTSPRSRREATRSEASPPI